MADVDLPGLGQTKKEWVYAGGALVAGIVGYAWIKRRSAAAAAVVPVDPNADVGATGYAGTPGYSSSAPVSQDSTGDAIDTNAKWTTYATEKLAQYGWDPAVVAQALGDWLAGQPLSDQAVNAVNSARGVAGDPPVGGPYPIKHALPTPAPGPNPGPPDTGGQYKIVHVKGGDAVAPFMAAHGWANDYSPFFALNPGAQVAKSNLHGFIDPVRNPESSDPGHLQWTWVVDQDVKVPA